MYIISILNQKHWFCDILVNTQPFAWSDIIVIFVLTWVIPFQFSHMYMWDTHADTARAGCRSSWAGTRGSPVRHGPASTHTGPWTARKRTSYKHYITVQSTTARQALTPARELQGREHHINITLQSSPPRPGKHSHRPVNCKAENII